MTWIAASKPACSCGEVRGGALGGFASQKGLGARRKASRGLDSSVGGLTV